MRGDACIYGGTRGIADGATEGGESDEHGAALTAVVVVARERAAAVAVATALVGEVPDADVAVDYACSWILLYLTIYNLCRHCAVAAK